jgi:predicted membrane chloride channel (bestrophin family)
LSTESIDFRTMVDVQRPHMERTASMVDMLQQEVHLLGPCPESLLAAIIRRLTFLIEHGLLHSTTGQVAFRALNSSNFSLASAHAARRTIVPLVVRDFLLSIMIFYIVFLPALVWASLGWFSVLFCGLVGGTFGGLLSSIEQLRRSQFNDDERLFIGINTHSWAVDAECTVATSFSSLWITAKVFGGEHWTEWALKRASVSGFKSS